MQSHYLPAKLTTNYVEPAMLYCSILDPSALVIFVHGFGGSAAGTWPDFHTLLTQTSNHPIKFDAIFYQYDGKFTQANNSAASFRNFLDHFLANPFAVLKPLLPSGSNRTHCTYKRILLVAHSLGAVVVRRALLDIATYSAASPRPWLMDTRLVLFAPAHKGAFAASIAQAILSSSRWFLGQLLGRAALYNTPLLSDLLPSSAVLRSLEDETKEVVESKKASCPYAIAYQVIWAEHEKVVQNDKFVADPPATLELGRDHMTVCKPKTSSDPVFQHVLHAL